MGERKWDIIAECQSGCLNNIDIGDLNGAKPEDGTEVDMKCQDCDSSPLTITQTTYEEDGQTWTY